MSQKAITVLRESAKKAAEGGNNQFQQPPQLTESSPGVKTHRAELLLKKAKGR